jgi:hypothetical protein
MANNEELRNNTEKAKEVFDELLFASRDFTKEVKEAAKSVFNNAVQSSEAANSFKKLADLSRDFASEIDDIVDGTKSISDLNKIITKQESAKKKFTLEYRQALSQAKVESSKIEQITSGQLDIYTALGDQLGDLSDEQLRLLTIYEEQSKVLNDQENTLEQVSNRAKTVESAFGGAGKVAEGLETALDKLGLSNLSQRLGIKDAIINSRQFASELTKSQTGPAGFGTRVGQQFKVLGKLAGGIGGNLIKSLGPVPIIIGAVVKIAQFFVKSMFDASKQVAEFQKDFGVSAEYARELRQRTYEISENSSRFADTQGRIIILQKQIVEAMNLTNLSLETQIDFTRELGKEFGSQLLVQTSILKDNIGLSAEAIGEIQKESIRTGTSVEDLTKAMMGTSAEASLSKGFLFDTNKILEEATKIQGEIRLNFKNSNIELSRGVTEAKRLGFELSTLNNSSKSLLNFEQSISAELEAELLTGRDLNLEKARQAALDGDLVGLSKELNNQGIKYNDLQEMNVVQREAFANAVGMSVDQLSDTLKKQEEYNALQQRALTMGVKISDIETQSLKEIYEANKNVLGSEEDLKNILGERLYTTKLAEDAQTRFNKSLEKAQEAFAKFAEGENLDKLANLLTKFVNAWQTDGLLSAIFNSGGEEVKPKSTILSSSENKQIGEDRIITASGPKFAKGGIVKREVNNATIGEAGPEAVIPLNQFYAKLDELIIAVKSGGDVYLDGTKVGTAMAVSSFKVQ